jgi:Zn-finger nucleic acid-binding protein
MNCPLCVDATLDVTFHGGIELDICPRCHGVWLDRGELDRLVGDRPTVDAGAARSSNDRLGDRRHQHTDGKKKRKKRLADRLGDVFEEIIDL